MFTNLILAVAASAVMTLELPDGKGGVGFDDLRYAPNLHRIIVPAGRTGTLSLVDPRTGSFTVINGFSKRPPDGGKGHDFGLTSADQGEHLLYAADRTSKLLDVVDPDAKKIVGHAALASEPDYVRFVAATQEVWVTEPDKDRIEIFSVAGAAKVQPKSVGRIEVDGGPESLVVDEAHGRAFTHLWKGESVVIDLKKRKVVSQWKNGCEGSRGIALDETAALLFVGCSEGKAVAIRTKDGQIAGSLTVDPGVDIIDYDPKLRHLYVPSAKTGMLSVIDVAKDGKLTLLRTAATAKGAHCVAVDGLGRAFVCDPHAGKLIVVFD